MFTSHTHIHTHRHKRLVSMNERVFPYGTKRIVSPLVNAQNIDHTEGTHKSVFSCLISLAFPLRCQWTGIFLFFKEMKVRLLQDLISWEQLWLRSSHVGSFLQLLLRAVLRATSFLLLFEHRRLWFWKAWRQRSREVDKISGDLSPLPAFVLTYFSLNGFLWKLGIQLCYSYIHLGYKTAYASLSWTETSHENITEK